jgi:hypothetical protein
MKMGLSYNATKSKVFREMVNKDMINLIRSGLDKNKFKQGTWHRPKHSRGSPVGREIIS